MLVDARKKEKRKRSRQERKQWGEEEAQTGLLR